MTLIVQKYGGSSLADAEKVRHVARRIGATRDKGYQVVAVCSAMGDTTDDLIRLAYTISPRPDPRELDLLLSTGEIVSCTLVAMALKEMGYPAVSLTGFQAGIRTERTYGKARIAHIDPQRILKELEEGKIVIVAGFQGFTEDMDITTLGRGGSDTTAVALAVALEAERCEIYTDVEGIYTADPRIVPEARKLKEIDYEEMLELAVAGAKMQPRSIELAALYRVPVVVASTFSDAPGTLIHGEVSMELRERVRGVASDTNVAKITVLGVPDRPGIAAALFEPLAQVGISVDVIVQNASVEGLTDLSFTVARSDLPRALEAVRPVAQQIGARGLHSDERLAKVSVVGTGMQYAPGYAARMFRALADAGINIEMITTSEIRITCIVREERVKEAVRALHKAFRLEEGG
ncbi:Aspartate kinase Ask_LysC [bacterium HR23]|nr:Aspartate kinase Ask_LysC [bacterium HR23]